MLLPFAMSFLREAGLSEYALSISKYGHMLNVKPDIRIKNSSIQPNLIEIYDSETKKPFI